MFKMVLSLLLLLNMAVLAQESSTISQPEGQQETQSTNPLQEEANRLTTHKITDMGGDMILLDNAMIVKMTGLKSNMFNINLSKMKHSKSEMKLPSFGFQLN